MNTMFCYERKKERKKAVLRPFASKLREVLNFCLGSSAIKQKSVRNLLDLVCLATLFEKLSFADIGKHHFSHSQQNFGNPKLANYKN